MDFLIIILLAAAGVVVAIISAARTRVPGNGPGARTAGFGHGASDAGTSAPFDPHAMGTGLPHHNPTSPHHDGGFDHSTNAPSFDGGHVGGGDFGGGGFGGGGDCGGGGGGGDGGGSCG
jgi:hypothetical protein